MPTDAIPNCVLCGYSPVLHVVKEPNGQQGADLQIGLELHEMPWWKYLVKTQTAGHLATSHYSADEQRTMKRNDPAHSDNLDL
jgi:hypothetical protein